MQAHAQKMYKAHNLQKRKTQAHEKITLLGKTDVTIKKHTFKYDCAEANL